LKLILLLGGGGHCRACVDVIEAEAKYQIVGIVQPPSDGQDAVLFIVQVTTIRTLSLCVLSIRELEERLDQLGFFFQRLQC
jgi:hypothetical protein